ncbi:MAG TPA: ribosome small subunit-dependent GTPase A [Anaerolineae bacterium]|nr:ribosome small subunit-dependent GTPase A [Anaerolineae bacterium]
MQKKEGLVVRAISGFFTVVAGESEVICQIAGRLKRGRRESDLVAVGDWVTYTLQEDGTGRIEDVAARERVLSRARPAAGMRQMDADQEQVLVANPDQVIIVFAAAEPAPSLRKLDRFLVVAEMNDLPVIICVNKIDLVAEGEAEKIFAIYEKIGYSVIYTSVVKQIGVDALQESLAGKLSVFTGSSGVGKSSLLNEIQEGLGLKVKSVSEATTKGMHTTRHVEMFPLDGGGYVADTPGIRGLALFNIEPEELDGYFREMEPLVGQCKFRDCRHEAETKCAIQAAVKRGEISPERYDSYLRLRAEQEELLRTAY